MAVSLARFALCFVSSPVESSSFEVLQNAVLAGTDSAEER